MATVTKTLSKSDGYVQIATNLQDFKCQSESIVWITYTDADVQPDDTSPAFVISPAQIEIRAGVDGYVWAMNPSTAETSIIVSTGVIS